MKPILKRPLARALTLASVLALASASVAHAKEGSGSHGGDDVELEFAVVSRKAAALLETHCGSFPEFNHFGPCDPQRGHLAAYLRALRNDEHGVQIIATDKTLRDRFRQVRTAINDATKRKVWVNRKRWQAIQEPSVRLGLVVHEMIVVSGMTDSDYDFSSRIAQVYLETRSHCRSFCVMHGKKSEARSYGADRAQAFNRLGEQCSDLAYDRRHYGEIGLEFDSRGDVTTRATIQNACVDL